MGKPAHIIQSLFVFTGFAVFIGVYYGHCFSGWWGWDDTQILKSSFQYSPWQYFFVPSVWREFQPANLNPWIIFSYDFDFALFRLNPQGFYAHHLLSLWLLACITYLLLRFWLTLLWSTCGALLFLCSASVTNTAYQLMTRHYLEGLLFFSITTYFFIFAVKKGRFFLACMGAVFYFLSVSAKEVYVILPFLLLMLPVQGLRKRILMAVPLFCVLIFYTVWRKYMLGAWIGGYSPSIDWHVVYPLILRIPEFIFGNGLIDRVAFFIVMVLVFYWIFRNPSVRALIFGSFLLLLGPIVPAIHLSDPQRLLLLVTWVLSLSVVLCLGKWVESRSHLMPVAVAIVALIGFSIGTHGWAMRPALERNAEGFEVQGLFVMEGGKDQVLLPAPQFGNWFLSGLVWLRTHMLGDQSPTVVYDEIDLSQIDGDIEKVFCFDHQSNDLFEVPGGMKAILSAWEKKRQHKLLQVDLKFANGVISWELGPYCVGQYSIITYGVSGSKMQIPQYGSRRKELTHPLIFRVRYDAPEGWITYSNLFRFDGKDLAAIQESGKTGL